MEQGLDTVIGEKGMKLSGGPEAAAVDCAGAAAGAGHYYFR
ncbi:hypothetical protein ACFSQ7_46220 [Paenibacillus rhizoplanae]